MARNKYRNRVVDAQLSRKLEGKGAVLIEGAKWCGKTSTAEQQAGSVVYMSDPEKKAQYLVFAEQSPKLILNGKTPRMIDEWQLAPELWDAIRFEVDHREGWGHFILTGSAVPPETEKITHTGTGRFAWIKMRPMTLWESGDSNGEVSLMQLFDSQEPIAAENTIDLQRMAFLVCRGGWPEATMMKDNLALEQAFDYYDAVVRSDIQRAGEANFSPDRVKLLMRSYARHQGTQASIASICADMGLQDSETADRNTVNAYLTALRKIFVVEDMAAWNPNLRSKTAIRSADTRYFVDPSIAVAALGLGPKDLMNDLNTFGLLFETLAVRDLRVFAEANNGTVYHYRDGNGLECDAVVHLRDGRFGLVEIKLGGETQITQAVKTLTTLAKKIDTSKMKEPSFRMVLTAVGSFAYRRPDGVYVVPIGCLRD